MDIAAMVMGANLVEKTITFDRCTRSVEHIFSLEPSEAAGFIQRLRDVEMAIGGSRRILHEQEKSKRNMIRRSAFLTSDAAKGSSLSTLEIEYRRPGTGLAPDAIEFLLDAVLNKDMAAGEMLTKEAFINASNWGLLRSFPQEVVPRDSLVRMSSHSTVDLSSSTQLKPPFRVAASIV